MTVRITRREALRGIGTAALATVVPALLSCAPEAGELEARLAEAVARLAGGGPAPTTVASAAPLARADALARLRGDASSALLWAATSTGVGLRALVARRHRADLRAGRVRWVHGWLLSETEVAAANLAAS